MKSFRFDRFCRTILLIAPLLEFSIAAHADLASIFTNAAAKMKPIPRRTSIIFIQCNGLGYGDLSCYGQQKFQTPNLDKLAAEGIRFTNYLAESPARSVAHAALLLGKAPNHLQQRTDADIPLMPDDVTIAQLLQRSGYYTGMIGEWKLGDENSSGAPWKHGFDEFAGYFDENDAKNFYADYIWRYAPKSILNTNNQIVDFIGREMFYYNTTGNKHNTYIPDVLAKAAANFVKNNQPDKVNHYRPFFLLLNLQIPGGGNTVPSDAPYSDEPWPQVEKNKAALIARLDDGIGQLREQLDKIRMTNNVVIFFSSDSVPKKENGVDPKFFKSVLSTNDTRLPLIVCWPETIPTNQVSGVACSAKDFLPTAADIAFLDSPTNIDGTSLFSTMTGKPR